MGVRKLSTSAVRYLSNLVKSIDFKIGGSAAPGHPASRAAHQPHPYLIETLEPRMYLSAAVLNPYGVAPSAVSSGTYTSWMPPIAKANIGWARLTPEWNSIQPTQGGAYNFTQLNNMISTAQANNMNISGLLAYNAAWDNPNGNTHTFPIGTTELNAWSAYVSAVVTDTIGKINYFEVWNEPEGFSSGGTPAQYAAVVEAAYNAAKAANPNVQIGLSTSSVNLNYLEQAIQNGAAGHFDYVAVHPYEVFGQIDNGWEGDYMSIVPTVHKMLAANDPAAANDPVWITEQGEGIGGNITAATQGQDLFKAYSMGMAEGFSVMEWFTPVDSSDFPNYGLLNSSDQPEPAYTAMQTLSTYVGTQPSYQGWVQLNANKDYGFVFQGPSGPVMALWATAGTTETISFSGNVDVVDPTTGNVTALNAGTGYTLTNAPVLITGLPASLVAQAQANKGQPFPWGGNYSTATSVSETMGGTSMVTDSGLHMMPPYANGTAVNIGGVNALDIATGNYAYFEVDPNFAGFGDTTITINATVMAAAGDTSDPGFGIDYESTTGLQHNINWFSIPTDGQWHTVTLSITNAEFDSMWGYNFDFDSVSSPGSYYLSNVTVTKGAPAAPTNLIASTVSSSQINLSWNAVSGATSYDIFRGTSSAGESAQPIATGIASTSYSNTGLNASTAYYYTVEAVNSAGTSTASNEASATTQSASTIGGLLVDYKAANYNASTGVWTDSSGNGDNATFTSAAGGVKPTLVSNATANGSSAVSFVTGTTGAMGITTPLDLTTASGFTIMTYTLWSNTSSNCIIGSGTANSLGWRVSGGKQDTLRTGVVDYGSGTHTVPQGTFSSLSISGVDGTANSGIYRLNGAADGTFTPSNVFGGTTSIIGTQANFTPDFTGEIAEIQIYNSVLTLAQKQAVESQFLASYASGSASLPTITDASFESPSVGVNGYQYQPAGSGWSFSGNAGIEANGSAWGAPNAPSGTQAAFLQSGGAGGAGQNGQVSQTIDFAAAGTYTLQFDIAGRGSQTQQLGVYLDGTLVGTYTPTSGSSWNTVQLNLNITTAGNHTLEFAAMNATGDNSLFLDALQFV